MKNLKLFTAITSFLLISALSNAQFWESVRGNGHVVSKERKTDSFTGIRVSSGVDVYLKQGNNISVTLEADENLHEYIITEVKNDVLHVYVDDINIRSAERKRVYVTMKEINSIRTSSAGDVYGESPIKAGDLKLSASSAGNISLEVTADDVEVDISSSGDITLSGDADILDANLSSAGDLNAYKLKVREADISVSSAGDADINVSERLTARASSAGDINYMGEPKYIDAHSSSAGGIHRRD
ncbi:MAG TPA: head GIN domain-containing protein [Bacteroidales bacterium]|nr:head GIN domain-containing protein [Bacteroidales bacterium]